MGKKNKQLKVLFFGILVCCLLFPAVFAFSKEVQNTAAAAETEAKTAKIKIFSVKLSNNALVYTGSPRTQTKTMLVRAWVNKKWVNLERSDYTVAYRNNTKVGTASVTVTGKGKYTGSITKTFSIVPKKTTLKSLQLGNKQITAKWTKQPVQTSGYQIQYSTSRNFPSADRKTKTVGDAKVTSASITGLSAGKTYHVRVRTYKTVGGKNYYSDWSASKSLKYVTDVLSVTGSGTTRTLMIKNPSSTASGLKAAVWSSKNGQDDLYWYTMSKQKDGSWLAKIEASRIADSGKCPVHVYTGKDTFLNGKTFSFTAKELESAGGKSLVHKYAKAILAETGNSLRGAYDWTVRNVPYQSMVVPMTLPTSGDYSVFTRQELYFIYAFENRKGNCFCHAATVYWCAKELGYSVRLIEGRVLLPSGAYGPHSWVELDTGNGIVILDPESEQELGRDGYWKTYENGPSLAYRPDLAAY